MIGSSYVTAHSQAKEQTEGALLCGRYEVKEVLGKGGMATVHRGWDRQLQRAVAIKLLSDPQHAERFFIEAKRTAKLHHSSVISIFDTGKDGPLSFIVMELLEGETLETRLDREGALPIVEVARIGARICEGLSAAHEQNIVHRDIKPANILLITNEAGAPDLKLLDFGVAKQINGSTLETNPGVLVGTLITMSPEQIRGEPLDGRSDLYSLGITLYRAACGSWPFEQATAAELLFAHMSVKPSPLPGSDGRPLSHLLERLLAKERLERPIDAKAVRAALLAILEAETPASVAEATVEAPPIPNLALDAPMPLEVAEEPEPAKFTTALEVDHGSQATKPQTLFQPEMLNADDRSTRPGLLASVPQGLAKRMAAYPVVLLLVLVVLFRVSTWVLVGLGLMALFGLAAYVSGSRER